MIDDMQYMNTLLDAYEPLLTTKQQSIMDMYYKEDFSLAEIGEQLHISRSAVSDHIKRSVHLLQEYEKKLNLATNYAKRKVIYDKIKAISSDEIKLLVEEVETIE